MFKLFGRKKESEEVQEPAVESTLSLLLEVPKNGIVQYFSAMGIQIEDIFYNIEEAQFGIMGMSDVHKRLVIVESGAGMFGKKENRIALEDILGMVDNKALDATVFYTDSGMKNQIKKDIKEKFKENDIQEPDVDYVEFESMSTVYDTLKNYNETYNVSGAKDLVLKDPLAYVAKRLAIRKSAFDDTEYHDDSLFVKDQNGESILGYKVKI